MRFFRRGNNPNTLVGIFLLVLLAIFAGPNLLPTMLPSLLPGADESIPCAWLRTGEQRAEHQSLIGRSASNPLKIRIRSSALPQQSGEKLKITIVITNQSIGTVAIVYNAIQVQIGDDGQTSGLGLAFNSPNPQLQGGPSGGSVPEEDIRLLGPRQSCIHHAEWLFEESQRLNLTPGQNIVKAYYRNTFAGISQRQNATSPIIFPDQGLWVGITESESIPIPFGSS